MTTEALPPPKARRRRGLRCLLSLLLLGLPLSAASGCRTTQQSIRFAEPPPKEASPTTAPPLAFKREHIRFVKEGSVFSPQDDADVEHTTLQMLRDAYGRASDDAPTAKVTVVASTPELESVVGGTDPALALTLTVTTELPNQQTVQTTQTRFVDQESALTSSLVLPGVAVLSVVGASTVALGLLSLAILPPIGVALMAANALVLAPGALLYGGFAFWTLRKMADKRAETATLLLQDTLGMHAAALAEAMNRPASKAPESGLVVAPVGALRLARVGVELDDKTGCLLQKELTDDVRALVPQRTSPGAYRLRVQVQKDGPKDGPKDGQAHGTSRQVNVRLDDDKGDPVLVRHMSVAPAECATLPRLIARMVRSHIDSEDEVQELEQDLHRDDRDGGIEDAN